MNLENMRINEARAQELVDEVLGEGFTAQNDPQTDGLRVQSQEGHIELIVNVGEIDGNIAPALEMNLKLCGQSFRHFAGTVEVFEGVTSTSVVKGIIASLQTAAFISRHDLAPELEAFLSSAEKVAKATAGEYTDAAEEVNSSTAILATTNIISGEQVDPNVSEMETDPERVCTDISDYENVITFD